MRNEYPLNLELAFKQLFLRELRKETQPLIRKVAELLRQGQPDGQVRADTAEDVILFLSDIKQKHNGRVSQETLEAEVAKHFKLIDGWAREKTKSVLAANYAGLETRHTTSLQQPEGEPGELVVPIINLQSSEGRGLTQGIIDDFTKRNVSLINKAYKDFFDKIASVVKEGVLSGKGYGAIARELKAAAKNNESKAAFWARDQVSKFFGEATRLRQTGAGIPGYVWRCMQDDRVRDRHAWVDGKFFLWNSPPPVGNKGERLHPGEGYNCRCWAEPAYGPEYADRTQDDIPRKNMVKTIKGAGVKEQPQEQPKASDFWAAKTVKEAEDKARGVIADEVNFKGVKRDSLPLLQEWISSLAEALEIYPSLRPAMLFSGTLQNHNKKAKAQGYRVRKVQKETIASSIRNEDVSGISINVNRINDPKLMENLRKEVAIKNSPEGCDTIRYVVMHEIGHKLTDLLKLDKNEDIIRLWNKYEGKKNELTDALSKYAWKNGNRQPMREFIAEAFAEYKCNPHCRPLARKIGKNIDKLYNKGR